MPDDFRTSASKEQKGPADEEPRDEAADSEAENAAETVNGNDGVAKFLDFLSSEAGQKNFAAFGFAPAKK